MSPRDDDYIQSLKNAANAGEKLSQREWEDLEDEEFLERDDELFLDNENERIN